MPAVQSGVQWRNIGSLLIHICNTAANVARQESQVRHKGVTRTAVLCLQEHLNRGRTSSDPHSGLSVSVFVMSTCCMLKADLCEAKLHHHYGD